MSLEALVPVFILGFFVVGLVLERVLAARPLPRVQGWYLLSGISFVATFFMNAVLPMGVALLVQGRAPLSLASLGTLGGALVAFLVSDLFSYLLHRAQHRVPWLWRWTHQLHHSAERVDVMGAAFFHPLDIAAQAAVSTLVVGLLGVTPDAAALSGIVTVLLAVFQHLNVRTPVWLGYLVQRPEAHSVHHERGVHAYNYGNLGLWDLVFRTFRNPPEFARSAGFYDGASRRALDMLLAQDVSVPEARRTQSNAPSGAPI
jgi:sterol desaturase/sphingolipid hydroxylase (fatty acid hydroxylase superfamily)